MSDVFKHIDEVSYTKETGLDEYNKNEYSPFLTNRHFSLFADSFLLSNKLNKCSNLDNIIQYNTYLKCLPKRNRFKKWYKRSNNDEIKLISEYYYISINKAKELLPLFDKDSINEIEKLMKKE